MQYCFDLVKSCYAAAIPLCISSQGSIKGEMTAVDSVSWIVTVNPRCQLWSPTSPRVKYLETCFATPSRRKGTLDHCSSPMLWYVVSGSVKDPATYFSKREIASNFACLCFLITIIISFSFRFGSVPMTSKVSETCFTFLAEYFSLLPQNCGTAYQSHYRLLTRSFIFRVLIILN